MLKENFSKGHMFLRFLLRILGTKASYSYLMPFLSSVFFPSKLKMEAKTRLTREYAHSSAIALPTTLSATAAPSRLSPHRSIASNKLITPWEFDWKILFPPLAIANVRFFVLRVCFAISKSKLDILLFEDELFNRSLLNFYWEKSFFRRGCNNPRKLFLCWFIFNFSKFLN